MTISLQVQLTPEDYIKAQALHLRPKPWLKYLLIALGTLSLCLLVASWWMLASLGAILRGLVLPILLLLFFFAILKFSIPANTRRIFAQQKNLQIPYQILISPETVEMTSEHGTTRRRLADFHTYRVSQDLITLYESQMCLFFIFPRRFFSSNEEFDTFISYLEANLGRQKR